MKILKIVLLSIIGALTVSSCSEAVEEPTPVSTPTTYRSRTLTLSEIAEINAFVNSVDSLNSTYYSTSRKADPVSKGIAVRLADGVGAKVGQRAGQWAGGAIGATVTANPFGAIIGSVVGNRLGGFIGGTAASAVAEIMLSTTNPSQSEDFKYDMNIISGNHIIDSIGYYHNSFVIKARNTIHPPTNPTAANKLILQQHVYRQILADCSKIDPVGNDEFFIMGFEQDFLSKFEPVWDMVYNYYNGSLYNYDFNLFMNDICLVLDKNFNFDEGDMILVRDYLSQINLQLDPMSEMQVHDYSFRLNNLIHSSNLNSDRKADVSLMTMITVNSKLCSM